MAGEYLYIPDNETTVHRIDHADLLISEDSEATVITSKSQDITVIQLDENSSVILNPVLESVITSDIQGEAIAIVDPGLPGFQPPTSGALFASNVSSQSGIVGDKVWEVNTVPAEVSILEATTDVDDVRVHILVEGGNSLYTPVVDVDGIEVTNLFQPTGNVRTYEGWVDTVVSASRSVSIISSTGATDSVFINRAPAGPVVQTITFGPYPGIQTELKENDTITVNITTDIEAVEAIVEVFGASKTEVLVPVVAGSASAVINVSSLLGNQPVRVHANNTLGTSGITLESIDTVVLNQTYPNIGNPTVVYPISQQAIKNSETVEISSSITDFDTVVYTTSAELSVSAGYQATKTVQRIGGSYLNANYTITSNRAANDATSSKNTTVRIANVAPTASISGLPTRLQSPGTYSFSINANQTLLQTATVEASVGTLVSTNLTIDDSTAKGVGTFFNLQVVGLAGLVGNTITSGANYEIGGFAIRQLTVPAFSQTVAIGTYVADFNKTRFRYAGTSEWLTRRTNTLNFVKGFTITDAAGNYDPDGNYAFITDLAFANSNSSGTLKVDIEEQI